MPLTSAQLDVLQNANYDDMVAALQRHFGRSTQAWSTATLADVESDKRWWTRLDVSDDDVRNLALNLVKDGDYKMAAVYFTILDFRRELFGDA